ncbi:SMP-30/gluconolactonase/LRE family protein [Sediminibacillus albus]|uniref:Regucalcin n=1 Tax=Sediminibacillus albus TaxID=407036 RepID=A0A1G9B8L6_9BACI|nr:SMP-30/gluconolactonase/LRE family protein [Sediminibacillus albus]SDK35809.1 Sugar lactone lactonase YvrE [Sediminibacillus albus]
MENRLELVLDAKAELGEGPFWDADTQRLYWVDINNKQIHIFDPADNTDKVIEVDQYIGAVVMQTSGDLLLAMQNGIYSMDKNTTKLTFIADPEKDKPDSRFNDGKCDPAGRFWAGTMPLQLEPGAASLYRLDGDNHLRRMVPNVTVSNGMAWSNDKQTMYFADTPTQKIDAFDYDLKSGNISNRRTVIKIPESEGMPDGMTIDTEGMLWVAQWGGARVGRWDPGTGECRQVVELPASHVSSCAFGGAEMNQLYITTAREHLTKGQLDEQPYAGGLFRFHTNVKGAASYKFSPQS